LAAQSIQDQRYYATLCDNRDYLTSKDTDTDIGGRLSNLEFTSSEFNYKSNLYDQDKKKKLN